MEWLVSQNLVPYKRALSDMEDRVARIHAGKADECVWLLEHPPLYTGGTSAKVEDLLNPSFPVFYAGRGGQYTYHGPGQRIGYTMLDLKKRYKAPDIKRFICDLESWLIGALDRFDIKGERRKGRIGIWVRNKKGEEKKIAALGVRIRHWISFHGVSLNVNPDLSHYDAIVPCGIRQYGTTSIAEILGSEVSMEDIDDALEVSWNTIFEERMSYCAA